MIPRTTKLLQNGYPVNGKGCAFTRANIPLLRVAPMEMGAIKSYKQGCYNREIPLNMPLEVKIPFKNITALAPTSLRKSFAQTGWTCAVCIESKADFLTRGFT